MTDNLPKQSMFLLIPSKVSYILYTGVSMYVRKEGESRDFGEQGQFQVSALQEDTISLEKAIDEKWMKKVTK